MGHGLKDVADIMFFDLKTGEEVVWLKGVMVGTGKIICPPEEPEEEDLDDYYDDDEYDDGRLPCGCCSCCGCSCDYDDEDNEYE
jgi:hypothetical protein